MKPMPADAAGRESSLETLALEKFIPFRLSVLSNRMTRAVARVYGHRFQLTAPEWRTMAVLGRYGAMTANSVVDRTAMDKVRVSRAVAKLLQERYITRTTDPEDRRRAILDLTSEGRGVYRKVVPLVRAVEEELLGDLDAAERESLHRLVAKLEVKTASVALEADGDEE